jgi:hypothetical protein
VILEIPNLETLEKLSNIELQKLLHNISHEVVTNTSIQHKYIISSMIINEIIQRRFLEIQSKNNSKIQNTMLFLTATNLIIFIYTSFFH